MKVLQFILYLLINGLFVAKYGSRMTSHPLLPVFLYVLFSFTLYILLSRSKEYRACYRMLYILLSIFGVTAIAFLLVHIDPYSVKVDRWSAIHNFIQNLLAGQYPYAARTHLGGYGSPFPVWQIVHIPFYWMGDVGLAWIFVFVLLSVLLLWLSETTRQAFVYLVLLMASPAFWYEVAVRSDILYNLIVCFLCIGVVYRKQYSVGKHDVGLGVMCGLLLSTRLSVAAPLIIFLMPGFLTASPRSKMLFLLTTVLVFVVSFLPFLFWDHRMLLFSRFNPFVLQTRQGNLSEWLLAIFVALFLSTRWKDFRQYSGYVAVCLVLVVAVVFMHYMIILNFQRSLFSSSFDISYLNMALPFLIFALTDGRIRKRL